MVFASLIFLFAFFVLHFAAMRLAPTVRSQNAVLLISSLIFYAWSGVRYLFVLIGLVFWNYIFAGLIARTNGRGIRRFLLFITCAGNLGVLGFFKYTGFLLGSLQTLTGFPEVIPKIVLPVGISFYTFQLLTYVVDVYRGEVPAQSNFGLLLLYTASFHQCIAGPIVRYSDVNEELLHRTVKPGEVSDGILRFCTGLAKKAVLANSCAVLADTLLPKDSPNVLASASSASLLLGGAAYMLQIYLDFSAYSDMAIGLGLMSGFHYRENFDYPYVSASVTEFWRRWHISLSSFFRDYVYIPLGGSRVSLPRHILNLLIVWFLTGLWHGGSWNFIFWGLWFFLFLVIEKFIFRLNVKKKPSVWTAVPRRIYLLAVVFAGWYLFRFTDLSMLWTVIKGIFCQNGNPFIDAAAVMNLKNYAFFLPIAVLACTPLYKAVLERLKNSRSNAASMCYNVWIVCAPVLLVFVSAVMLVGDSYNPFLYFQF